MSYLTILNDEVSHSFVITDTIMLLCFTLLYFTYNFLPKTKIPLNMNVLGMVVLGQQCKFEESCLCLMMESHLK